VISCHYCFTGTTGEGNLQEGEYRLVASMLREGPFAEPTHVICHDCYEKKVHLARTQCGWCGKLSSLLRTSHDSMTNKWVSLGKFGSLCAECSLYRWSVDNQGFLEDGKYVPAIRRYPEYVILSDDDIEILKRCWREYPDWKKMTKMPVLRRRIDD
jgi:hypothetical protein